MIFGIPLGELALVAAAILAAGIISGLLAGLFGIGGSTVIIPVLYEIFRLLEVPDDVRMQLSIGTALAVTIPTTLRAYFAHRAKGAVLPDVIRVWALPTIVGVALGTAIAYVAPAALFKAVFIGFVLFMAAKLLFGRETWRMGGELPGHAAMAAIGVFIGGVSTLVGIAGGSISTMFLTLYGKPFHTAVATSSGLGVFIAIPATLGYMLAGWQYQASMPPASIGFVSIVGFLLVAPASVLAAPYGARLAHALSKRMLEIAFGLFLLLVAARFFASLV
jgi:uncharacterized membrane protein YfcA